MATDTLKVVQVQFGFRELNMAVGRSAPLDLVNHAEQLALIAAAITRIAGAFEELPGDLPGTVDFSLQGVEFLGNFVGVLTAAASMELEGGSLETVG